MVVYVKEDYNQRNIYLIITEKKNRVFKMSKNIKTPVIFFFIIVSKQKKKKNKQQPRNSGHTLCPHVYKM